MCTSLPRESSKMKEPKCFGYITSKAIGAQVMKVIKLHDLACGETLTKQPKISFL